MCENLECSKVWTSNCCGVPFEKNGEEWRCSYCGEVHKFDE